MTRVQLFRLASALGSFGSLVAVVGAGTKWGVVTFMDTVTVQAVRHPSARTQVGMLTDQHAPEPVAAPAATGSRRSPYLYPMVGFVLVCGLLCFALTCWSSCRCRCRLGRRRPAVLPAAADALRRRAAGHPGAAR